MVRRFAGIVVVACATAGALACFPDFSLAGQAVNAETVAGHMDKSKHSTSDIKSYLKGLKGRGIAAQGTVKDVMVGKTGNRVVVFVNVPGRKKDFVVDVYVDSAGKLHKGDHVSCRGEYAKYNMFTVNGITLKDGICSKR